MLHCRDENELRRLIAYAMATDERTNPEGLSVETFLDRLSTKPMTNELISEWLSDYVELPENNTHNHYEVKYEDWKSYEPKWVKPNI